MRSRHRTQTQSTVSSSEDRHWVKVFNDFIPHQHPENLVNSGDLVFAFLPSFKRTQVRLKVT